MTDQRFEDWWSRSPARVALSPAAKEVARGVWQAAREDLVTELNGSGGAGAPKMEPVEGDLLPAIGEQVFIHLARSDRWVLHTVCGYYVWPDLDGSKHLQRVNVRVRDSAGYLNARMLCDMRRADGTPFVKGTPC